jgi:hypothetical protein
LVLRRLVAGGLVRTGYRKVKLADARRLRDVVLEDLTHEV